jgi:hypothetical protein
MFQMVNLRRVLLLVTFVVSASFSSVAFAQLHTRLMVVQDDASGLFNVNSDNGNSYYQVGSLVWAGATSMAASTSFDAGYIIQGSRLWVVNYDSGERSVFPGQAGVAGAWGGDTKMTYGYTTAPANSFPEPALFITQDGSLWRVRLNGTYVSLGAGWAGTTSITHATLTLNTKRVFAIQDSRLWSVNPDNGACAAFGGPDWGGPTQMTTDGSSLFVIQDNTLWKVDPNTGMFVALTGAVWPGATSMAWLPSAATGPGVLDIIQNNRVYQVTLSDNAIHTLSDPVWGGSTLMSAQWFSIR